VRVLVTGATTSIGEAIVAELLRDPGVEHVLAIVGDDPLPRSVPRLAYQHVDLTRPRAVHDLLYRTVRRDAIDTIVHAPLHRSARHRGPRVHALNVETTHDLLIGCEHHPTVRRFVYRSAAEVYAVRATEPNLLDEDTPLEFDPGAPQWVRDRVEGDLAVCARAGMSSLEIVVLRCAEILAPGCGSQLWDYLQSKVCLRPLGFDPMINVLSLEDAARAVHLAAASHAIGILNVPGADTLPLSRLIAHSGRHDIPVPGPLLAPLYRLRTWTVGFEFRYDANLRRFHFGGIVDGTRARDQLGYVPAQPLRWREAPRDAA